MLSRGIALRFSRFATNQLLPCLDRLPKPSRSTTDVLPKNTFAPNPPATADTPTRRSPRGPIQLNPPTQPMTAPQRTHSAVDPHCHIGTGHRDRGIPRAFEAYPALRHFPSRHAFRVFHQPVRPVNAPPSMGPPLSAPARVAQTARHLKNQHSRLHANPFTPHLRDQKLIPPNRWLNAVTNADRHRLIG